MNPIQDLVAPIKYVGPRDEKHDTVNHTGTIWKKGQTVLYPAKLAKALLVHTDVWRIGRREDIKEGSDDHAAIAAASAGAGVETGATGQGRENLNDRTRASDPPVSKLASQEKDSPTKGSRATLE